MPWIQIITGRRTAWLVALLPLVLAALVILFVGEAERQATATDSLPAGLDSTEEAPRCVTRFPRTRAAPLSCCGPSTPAPSTTRSSRT